VSPLGSVGVLRPPDRTVLPSVADGVGPRFARAANAGASEADPSRRAPSENRSAQPGAILSLISPEATIRQAEMLLQIALTTASSTASSPVLRQIATAAYQMEVDARREVARLRTDAAREWFA